MGLIEDAVSRWHQFVTQSSNPATPSAGRFRALFKAGGFATLNSSGSLVVLGGGAITTLTIATGAIAMTGKHHLVDTQSAAATDDLDTISGGYAGQELILQAANDARTVVIRHNIGNIRTPSGFNLSLDTTSKLAHLFYDGTNWNLVGESAIYPNNLSAWGDPPDGTLKFAGQFTDNTLWYFTGNEMRAPIPYTITSSSSFSVSASDFVRIDSATDRAVTMNGTPAIGHVIRAKAIQVSGGTGHTLKLPTGYTFDGTNNTATFNAVTDFLEAWVESSSRYFATNNTVGVTYSAT